jgi:rhomboid protease GluP
MTDRQFQQSQSPLRPPPAAIRMAVPQATPFWTYVILVLNIMAYLATAILGQNFVLGLGAKINQAIVAGEFWRLFTAMFLHIGLLHIGFNSYGLFIFGPQVERPFGRFRFLLIYFLSGLSGSAFSFLFSPHPSVGASGAIFGLIGAVAAYLYRYRHRLAMGGSRLMNILTIVGYNLIYGFITPSVDNWGHIGGLLAGVVLGWSLAPRYHIVRPDLLAPPEVEDRPAPLQWAAGLVVVSAWTGLVVVGGMMRWGS